MTIPLAPLAPARTRRSDRADAFVAAALAGLAAALGLLVAAGGPAGGRPAGSGRVAIVVDAGARPAAALAAAERAGGAGIAVRVPHSAFEAAADVRYFAAQRYSTVVAVGPLARAAARAAAGEYPRTRFAPRAQMPWPRPRRSSPRSLKRARVTCTVYIRHNVKPVV
jgi:hypothetical protein